MASIVPPTLPVPLTDLVKHIGQHPETPMVELIEPYRKYEAHLREAYAQNPGNALLKDPQVNVLPLFTEDTQHIKVRARSLSTESKEDKSRYIMPLPNEVRRPNGSPAIVPSLKEFQRNFNVFSESSLIDLDWSNVVAAGSSVVNTLLPVPDQYSGSKRGLREFYHEKFSPASDVDLFLYGLTEEQAIEKIKAIETAVRDTILTETTVVRTKHAVTICSHYPTRHIQIVLRIYKSVSEILAGFDIDCSGAAYDGKQVYCTPRALQSYITQINHIDLSRRSPSYENRLSKYSHRGFEVYWPDLDRSRIDPTIFERSFQRTLGLARLLVLERLPTSSARDQYSDKRREERGRPRVDRYHRYLRSLRGNIKEAYEDEVADWFTEEEVSNYHTFTIPYGPKFNAKRIEKLCYTRDLLLNAEWNQPDDREVYLHRHPAFFGRFEDVVHDCCGYCPVPETEEEKEIAQEEEKVFVSGRISFIKDDPGRQQIGSFNPLTDDDWTEMAYVGDTARLCQAIVDGDLEHVMDWLAQEGVDPNTRDYTGRTPLHLAAMSSTPHIVRALVDAGARLVARLADGRTALHLAAARGDVEILKVLLEKSAANEAESEEKKDQRRREKATAKTNNEGDAVDQDAEGMDVDSSGGQADEAADHEAENMDIDSDGELVDGAESDDEARSMATGSFVKVEDKKAGHSGEAALGGFDDEDEEEPDFYDINVISWDTPCSALHFAIFEGHVEVVKLLVQEYGADVLLPVKFSIRGNMTMLTLMLALALPVEKARQMIETLLSLGATSAQADLRGVTAFHRFVEQNAESLLVSLLENDPAGTKTAANHIVFYDWRSCQSPLQVAVEKGHAALVSRLLDLGAVPHIDFETWLRSAKQATVMENQLRTFEENQMRYKQMVEQPLILALRSSYPESALALLERGADPNVVNCQSHSSMQSSWRPRFIGESALDIANNQLKFLGRYKTDSSTPSRPALPEGIDDLLSNFQEGTYQHWVVSEHIDNLKKSHQRDLEKYEKDMASPKVEPGVDEKATAIKEAIKVMENVKAALLAKGAKTFSELYPEFKDQLEFSSTRQHGNPSVVTEEKATTYSYTFSFHRVNDVTTARKEAYLRLFDAAWNGDLETIKTLTLTPWDDAKEEAPLKIAVQDQNHNDPFSLAFSRKHYDVAKAILEITQAQYTSVEKPKTRYRMQTENDSECSDEDSDDDDARPRIQSEIFNDQLTIDNVGKVSMKVDSHTKPLELLHWTSPLTKVISMNDMEGLKFLIEVGERWTAQQYGPDDEVSGFYFFPDPAFTLAVELGRVELLGEIIQRTGAGLPLEHLVRDTGVELKVKPRYYQGLTVYGEKRHDWATEGHAMVHRESGTQTSPLLLGALAGRIETVEWFLSDAPLRHYLTFAKSKAARDDARLKHLARAPGGFDGAISRWLGDQNDLVLHAAVYATPSKRATDLVAYLIRTQPSLLAVKAANGVTPLMLACRLGRLDVAKLLIDAGADQTTKDHGRNNLLHAALHNKPDVKKLKPLLDVLNPVALVAMLKERNSLEHNGCTPLHQYCSAMASYRCSDKDANEVIRMIKLLVGISPETARAALKMLDGTGDTPLHTLLARDAHPALVHALIDIDTSLLCCENAVGRTPFEVAHDRYLADTVKPSPSYYHSSYYQNPSLSALVNAPLHQFVKERSACDEPKEHEASSPVAKNWRRCAEIMARIGQPKRTLVSLHSANFVAQRLGEQHTRDRYRFQVKPADDGDSAASTGSPDDADKGNAESKPAGPVEKRKRRRTDVISSRYGGSNSAWVQPKRRKRSTDGNEDDKDGTSSEENTEEEDDTFPLCSKCGRRHY